MIATLKAKPGSEAEVRAVIQEMVQNTRKEEGCLLYDVVESLATPVSFTFVEKWTDQEALAKHAKQNHMKVAGKALSTLLSQPAEVVPCKPFAVSKL